MSDNLVDVIVTDHREVEELFKQLESRQGTADERRETADKIISELVRHSVAEEMYMYPAARQALPNGDELADHEIEEHAEAERLMKDLEKADASDPSFDEIAEKLIAEVRHHIEDEEKDLLPALRNAYTVEDLDDLGAKVVAAKKRAPTHPHPSAPDTPPANKLLAPGAGLVDRLRDALTK